MVINTHIRLFTKIYDKCLEFYKKIGEFNYEWEEENLQYADFQIGNLKMILINALKIKDDLSSHYYGYRNNIFIEVPSLDSIINDFQKKGISFKRIFDYYPLGFPIKAFELYDPDKNRIEIFEITDKGVMDEKSDFGRIDSVVGRDSSFGRNGETQ